MKITAVEVYRKDLPLETPFQHFASGSVRALEEVYVRLLTDEGPSGLGEARGNSHYLTGDTPDRVVAEVLQHLGPKFVGRDPRDGHASRAELDRTVVGAHGARSALDMALHDLVGAARTGVPVFELLGGAVRASLPSNQSIFYGPPDGAASQAAAYVADGFRHLKVRAGLRPFQRDVDRIGAVREAIGPDVSLAIDLNMAWTAREAVTHLRRLAPFDLAYVEQPVDYRDLAGLRHVTQHTDIPIMADESVQSLDDVLVLARDRVVDLLHLKLIKLGGIAGLWRAAAVAEYGRPRADDRPDERGRACHGGRRALRARGEGPVSRALRIRGARRGSGQRVPTPARRRDPRRGARGSASPSTSRGSSPWAPSLARGRHDHARVPHPSSSSSST